MMFDWFRRMLAPPADDQLRVSQFLAGYPLYAPPMWTADSPPESLRAASAQYRDFFIANIPARLEALRAFLANFDVALSLDDAGLMAVSAWLPRYGDLLIYNFADDVVLDAYRTLSRPWTGPLVGLNVIFDLGVYHAECLWARRTKLKWQVHRGFDANGDLMAGHYIVGIPGGKWFDPFNDVYWDCRNIRAAKNGRKNPGTGFLASDCFYRRVVANAPPGRRRRSTAR